MSTEKSSLPKGWTKTTLGEITIEKVTQGLRSDEAEINYIDIASIDNNLKQIVGPKTIDKSKAPSRARQNVKTNDVLVSMTRPNLNAVAKIPDTLDGSIASTGFDVLRTLIVEPDWVFLNTRSKRFIEEMTLKVQGALYPAIKSGDVRAYELPLPPLNEQRRITAKIDTLHAKSQKAKAALDAARPLLDKLRQSVLAAAFRGDLTAEWRKKNPDVEPASVLLERIRTERRKRWEEAELAKMRAKGKEPKDDKWKAKYKEPEPVDTTELPELPEGWCWANMSELSGPDSNSICAGPFGTIFKARDFRSEGIPIIFLRHVAPGKYLTHKPGFMDVKKWQELFKPYSVYGGELLVTKLGDPPGVCAIYPKGIGPAMVTPDVIKMEPDENIVLSKFLMHYLNSESSRRYTFGVSYGVTRLRMNLSIFRCIPVPLAPYSEQIELVKIIGNWFAGTDKICQKIDTSRENLSTLNQSILMKAFRGELVSQDPNDEPASVLLERIRAERVAKPAQSKKGTRSKKKETAANREKKTAKGGGADDPDPGAVTSDVLPKRSPPKADAPKKTVNALGHRFEKADVITAFRKAIFRQRDIDEHTLLRLVGQRLGVQRLSQNIRRELESYIRPAIRRKIIVRDKSGYNPATPTIQQYEDDDLTKALKSVIRKGYEYPRDQLVEEAAKYLGFEAPSDAFKERLKSVFRKAIRNGILYRNGEYVGKSS